MVRSPNAMFPCYPSRMILKSLMVRLLNSRANRAFEAACRDPELAQGRLWSEIWPEIGESPFWLTRRPSASPKLEDFPISTYEDYREPLENSFQKSISDLSGHEILFWCTTSGTSGYRKVFPLTDLLLREMQRTTKPYTYGLARLRPAALSGSIVYCAAAQSGEATAAGIEVGYISAYIYRTLPDFIRRNYAFPGELFENGKIFAEWSSLYATIADCSLLLAITPASLSSLGRAIMQDKVRNLAIIDGAREWPTGLPEVAVSSHRLKTIRNALEEPQLSFKKLWPKLSVVTTWKGSTCALQIPDLLKYLDDSVLVTDGQYSATEGWMTVPFIDDRVGSVFHPGAHIVEFLEDDKILKPWQLVAGREYEILLTTAMGFVRYRLGDVVACRGFHHRSPILEFRTKAG
ncbi:MAG: GH3 auxin-responsive promoter family protein, partial [Bdellovibrionota bacterium]